MCGMMCVMDDDFRSWLRQALKYIKLYGEKVIPLTIRFTLPDYTQGKLSVAASLLIASYPGRIASGLNLRREG